MKDREECLVTYLFIILLLSGEEGADRPIGRDDEPRNIDKEMCTAVEGNQGEVQNHNSKCSICLWNMGCLLNFVQKRILLELYIVKESGD